MSWFTDFFGDLTGTGQSSAREQNQMNRDFQQQMSNTEVQRRRADMEKAGINPILAAGGGAGGGAASAPSGNAGAGGQGAGIVNNITNSAVNMFSKWAQAGGQGAAATQTAATAEAATEALETVVAILM